MIYDIVDKVKDISLSNMLLNLALASPSEFDVTQFGICHQLRGNTPVGRNICAGAKLAVVVKIIVNLLVLVAHCECIQI